jgi:two-component system alkaline phosphatase synthesis response regulator PhoP
MKARVLIVDDEPDYLNLLEFNLLGQGFEVISAPNGLEGLRRARCDAPQVIILDLMLPDMDGLSVCQILRSQPGTRDVPVIILSALEPPLKRSRAEKAQFACWLKKGVGFEALIKSVRGVLENGCQARAA